MARTLYVVGSSVVDSHAGDWVKKHRVPARKTTPFEVGSSFLYKRLPSKRCSGKPKQDKKRPVIVSELGGQYEENFEDIKKQLLNYFTYKAVRTVLHQLYEMNPPQYTWFYNFVANNNSGDGKLFLRSLAKEKQDLAERVMVTRLHLYGKWVKKCNHEEMYQKISNENLELMRERLMETVIWPSEDSGMETSG